MERRDSLPKRIGDFEIVRPIGAGGFGSVFIARQTTFHDRIVALKVVLLDDQADGQGDARGSDRQDVETESRVISLVHHPHVPEAYAFGFIEHEGRQYAYLAMRFVEGATYLEIAGAAGANVRGRARRARFRRLIVERMVEIASAVAELHSKYVLHLDIKPENLIGGRLDFGPEKALLQPAMLVDFGLSQFATGRATEDRGGFTPFYAAPEQLDRKGVDERTDVFAFGVTLFDLLALDDHRREHFAAVMMPIPEDVTSGIDRDLCAIVAQATALDPAHRYRSMRHLEADLLHWLADEEVDARRSTKIERVRRFGRRHSQGILRAVLVCSLLFLVFVAQRFWREEGRLVDELRTARRENDVERWAVLAEKVSWPRLEFFSDDDENVRLVEKFRDQTPGDPFCELVRRVRAGDRSGAIIGAATALRRANLECEDAVRDWFLEAVRDDAAHRSKKRQDRSPGALFAAARLAYEVELPTPRCDPLLAKYAETAFAVASDREAPMDVFLDAMTLIGGSASIDDVPRVLLFAVDAPEFSESRRMALAAASRIIRRFLAEKSEGSPVGEEILAVIGRLGAIRIEPDGVVEPRMRALRAARLLLATTAFILARRTSTNVAASRFVDFEPYRPTMAYETVRDVTTLLAAARDPSFEEWLDDWRLRELDEVRGADLGFAIGLLDDPEKVVAMRLELKRRFGERGDRILSGFERGAAEAADFLAGREPLLRPDPETLLGEEERTGVIKTIWHTPVSVRPKDDTSLAAGWTFSSRPIELERGAVAVTFDSSEHVDADGATFLKLSRFGRSFVELTFAGNLSLGDERVSLVLEHQIGLRRDLPEEGRVRIGVELNGEAVHESFLCFATAHTLRIDLPPMRLSWSPQNVIRITSVGGTTTTYRLTKAEIRVGE